MKDVSWVLSEFAVLQFFAAGIVLFAGFWILKILIRRLPIKRVYKIRLNRILPIMEGLAILGFLLWGVQLLVENEFWNSIGLLVISLIALLMISWFLARDFLAGIILKSDGSLNLNDWIKIKDIKGKVISLGYRSMIMETEVGETVNIPYAKISNEVSIRPNPSEKIKSHAFKLSLSKNGNYSQTEKLLRSTILNAPWSSVKKMPQIKLIEETETQFNLEVIIYSMRMAYFHKIKNYLKTHLPQISWDAR